MLGQDGSILSASNWTAGNGALYPFDLLGTGAGSGQVQGIGCAGMKGGCGTCVGGGKSRRSRRSRKSRKSRKSRRSNSRKSRRSRRYTRSRSRKARRSTRSRSRKSRRMRFRGGFAPINEDMSIATSNLENNIPSSQYYGIDSQLDNTAFATPIPIISSEKCHF